MLLMVSSLQGKIDNNSLHYGIGYLVTTIILPKPGRQDNYNQEHFPSNIIKISESFSFYNTLKGKWSKYSTLLFYLSKYPLYPNNKNKGNTKALGASISA